MSHISDFSTHQNGTQNQRESKWEKHRSTVITHSTLTAIASKAAICKQSLSLPLSQSLLQKVESELSCLHLALKKLSCDVPTVSMCKEEVWEILDTLDGQLIKLQYLFPKLDQGSFAYDTG
jgi:hypothetical protein